MNIYSKGYLNQLPTTIVEQSGKDLKGDVELIDNTMLAVSVLIDEF